MEKLLLYGNSNLTTRKLNATETGYDEAAVIWNGLVSVDITFTQTNTKFPADNNPNYKSIKGMPSGTGTYTLRGVRYSDYVKITNAINSAEDGVDFGTSDEVMPISLAVTEEVDDGSQNRHILYKVTVESIPPFSSETVGDTTTPRDIPISVTVDPLMKPGDNSKWQFYKVLNSKENAAKFELNKNDIIFPFPVV